MTALSDARAHLAKAREFFQAAEASRDRDLYNAATSAAVVTGVNAKDAICLVLTGRTKKGDNHEEAIAELRAAGRAGAALTTTLSRLLKLKTKAQYQPASVSATDATKAVEWAERLLGGAEDVVSNR